MRSSRVSVWAVGLLLGISGCAGVQRRGPVAAPDGAPASVASAAAEPGGLRGWWSRRVAARYSTTAYSEAEAVPPASPFPVDAGGGWGSVFRFSRPPWITRQPQRAAILGAAPTQPAPTPAEINRAIARMTADRRADDRVLPVSNVDDREDPAATGPVRLPDALADAPLDDEPVDPEAAEPRPSVPAAAAALLGVKPVEEPAEPAPDVAEPADADPKVAIAVGESVERPAVTSPGLEAASREIHDDAIVRSSQLPPPPPIRPEPGAQAPLEAPAPKDAPKPAAPAEPIETPKPVEAPALEPAEAPKPVEAPKLEEAPKAVEVPKAEETPKAEEALKPVETPKAEPTPPPAPVAEPEPSVPEPGARGLFEKASLAPRWPAWEPAPTGQTRIYSAPVATSFAAPAPVAKPRRWWRWNWKSGGGGHVVTASPQAPATLPPATFPTSYESVWARPLVPSPQAAPVFASPQFGTTAGKAPCWLLERLKTRVSQVKAWKDEHICRHLRDFKAALKGGRCEACRHAVTASPQAAPSPRAAPSPQGLPVIGGSRFGMY